MSTTMPEVILAPEDYLTRADRLPPAPRVLPQLLSLLSDPDCETSKVIELISFDPALTAKVLRICNSVAFGLARPVTDIDEAVQRLGLRMIHQMVTAAVGSQSLQAAPSALPSELSQRLWEQSVTTALAAQMLAKDLRLDEGVLFTAGLLHDLGKVVLAAVWNEKYVELLEQTAATPPDLVRMEEETFRVNHGELGGRLLALWKFPPAISASVWHHANPRRGIPFERETACLNLAEFIADNVTATNKEMEMLLSPSQETALAVFGFSREQLKAYVIRTQENFAFVNAMCQVRG
jgi:putative nucleotidyltransferase with HDIG domain